jgi:hypothetical protein
MASIIKTTAATPDGPNKRNAAQDPAALLMAALQASAKASNGSRQTSQTHREVLAQPLTDRDKAALAQMGWTGKLSSNKTAEPRPTAKVRSGPTVNAATFAELSPERQASTQFWAGLCSTLARSNGRVWMPEAAAVAAQLNVVILGPSQLATRLAAKTGQPVNRPADQAGWLTCQVGEMAGAQLWAQLWNQYAAAYGAAILTR